MAFLENQSCPKRRIIVSAQIGGYQVAKELKVASVCFVPWEGHGREIRSDFTEELEVTSVCFVSRQGHGWIFCRPADDVVTGPYRDEA